MRAAAAIRGWSAATQFSAAAARWRSSALGFARAEPLLLVLVLASALAYAIYAVFRHLHLDTSVDLAIFDQAVWHYSNLETPSSTLAGSDRLDQAVGFPSILGDHFHLILVLLAPLYWVWADPRMLLIAQAVLVAASIVPVFLFARARVGRLAAYLLAVAYALFWAIHSAVAYDFHEVAFAPLLTACAILFADQRRWRACFVSLALLLLVKEDLSIFVATFGVYLVVRGHPRQGAAAIAAGVAWFFIATDVLIPHFAEGRAFRHWSYPQFGSDLPDAIKNVIRFPGLPFHELLDVTKIRTILYLLVPFLGLILYSPILILAVPLVAERMLSVNGGFWGTDLHYSLAISAVIAMGAAEGLANVVRFFGRGRMLPLVATAAAVVMLAGNFALAKRFPLWQLTSGAFYDTNPGRDEMARVPPRASVAAQARLLPQLSRREEIYVIRSDMPETDYIVYTPGVGDAFPNGSNESLDALVADREKGRYEEVFFEDGVRLLKRR